MASTTSCRRTSILLNNSCIPSSSSSSASDVGDIDSSSSNSTQQRQQQYKSPRIRFAPLPDPRRDDIPPATTPPPLPPPPLPPDLASPTTTHPMTLLSDSNILSPTVSPSTSPSSPSPPTTSPASTVHPVSQAPPSNPHTQPRSHSPSCDSKRSWKTKNLLKPLLRRSASPFPPSPHFNISTEDILTLGTLHLFRARSGSANANNGDNESVHSTASSDGEHSRYGSWGRPLSRFTSTNSSSSAKSAPTRQVPPLDTASLSRTQSAGDFGTFSRSSTRSGRPRSRSDDPSPPSSARYHLSAPISPAHRTSPLPSPTPATPSTSKTGTRLLNGRVYGARRHEREQRNLFLSAKDAEPEFVEWGYGGMGSVAASRGKVGEVEARYGKLQRAGVVLGGGKDGEDAEEDDGGGVSWVKRRKEKREREAKEKAEREKAAAEAGETNAVDEDNETKKETEKDTDTPVAQAVQAAPDEDIAGTGDLPTPTGPTPFPTILSTSSSSATIPIPPPHTPTRTPGESTPTLPRPLGEHHVLTTTLPPALVHSHSHSHSHQRTMSRTGSAVNLNLRDGQVDVRAKSEGEAKANGDAKTGEDVADEKTAKTEAGAKVEAKVLENSEEDEEDEDEDSDSSEREADSEADDDDDDEEEEEDSSAATEAARRTALGAGVEKVSRHKEENPKSAVEGATATSPVSAPGEAR